MREKSDINDEAEAAKYEAFVKKFKPRLTPDDCYTPAEVYEVVLSYVRNNFDIDGCEVLRPFKPGGDYKNEDYSGNCVVVDNPPFSILSEIKRFYLDRNIRFFLFAPHLTLFSTMDDGISYVVADARIVYENGAIVNTSFVTNMACDFLVLSSSELKVKIGNSQKKKGKEAVRLKHEYPNNVLTISRIAWLVNRGVDIRIHKRDLFHIRSLAAQKSYRKRIFGSGWLISDRMAAEMKAAEMEIAEKSLKLTLSDQELDIVARLG